MYPLLRVEISKSKVESERSTFFSTLSKRQVTYLSTAKLYRESESYNVALTPKYAVPKH